MGRGRGLNLAVRYKTMRDSELNADDFVHKGITAKADAVSLSGYTSIPLASCFGGNKIIN